jgi:hypothetical protein
MLYSNLGLIFFVLNSRPTRAPHIENHQYEYGEQVMRRSTRVTDTDKEGSSVE